MNQESRRELARDLARLSELRAPVGARLVRPGEPYRFTVAMDNHSLTPQGKLYESQRLQATFDRTVKSAAPGELLPAEYTWDTVACRTSGPTGTRETAWTFATGCAFRSILLHARLDADSLDDTVGTEETPRAYLEVSYPSLPKTPAVSLLTLLSWDIVTFEMLCSHLANLATLDRPGATSQVDRVSNTWASLEFPGFASSSVFRNGIVSATWLGIGVAAERPCAVFGFSCPDGELDVHTDQRSGGVAQRGTSSYWGHVLVDLETGDVTYADMTETILATVTGSGGKQAPVHKRRDVRLAAAIDPPAPSAAGPSSPRRAQNRATTQPWRVAELADLAGQCLEGIRGLEQFLRDHRTALDELPDGLSPLAQMGFKSLTGYSITQQLKRLSELGAALESLVSPNAWGPADMLRAWSAYEQDLQGFVAYTQLAAAEATRRHIPDTPRLRAQREDMERVRDEVTALVGNLNELAERCQVAVEEAW